MRRAVAALILALGIVPFAWAGAFPKAERVGASRQVGCGVERWSVKTLADPLARTIVGAPRRATIRGLRRREAPIAALRRIDGVETTTYRVRAKLLEMKLEDDSDIHLVVADPNHPSATMIVEFPHSACTVGASSKARAQMRRARNALVDRCGVATRSFSRLRGTATITGVGFFDQIHGQTGVAPNGIELHPALGFTRATCASRAPIPPGPPPSPGRGCAKSYPTVCIPPPPPDLDCADVPYRSFRVRWDVAAPDPHGFDGDRDGIGCES